MDDEKSIAQFKAAGGPVFPAKWELPSGGSLSSPGMTLRDWFAGQALGAILTLGGSDMWNTDRQPPIASLAYEIGDAMLEARGKGAQ